MPAFILVATVSAGIWWACLTLLQPLTGMDAVASRLAFALQCAAVAAVFTLLAMVEAVAHERLATPAFNPLAGRDSRTLQVNARVLQNTLEQFVLFVAGLVALAAQCPDGSSMRAVVAATAVWVLSRYAFWIGYHVGPEYRVPGLVGQAQSMLVLLYTLAVLAGSVAGTAGTIIALGLYAAVEAAILVLLRRR